MKYATNHMTQNMRKHQQFEVRAANTNLPKTERSLEGFGSMWGGRVYSLTPAGGAISQTGSSSKP